MARRVREADWGSRAMEWRNAQGAVSMRSGNERIGSETRNDRDGHTALLEAPDLHTVISGTDRLAETVTDVVDA